MYPENRVLLRMEAKEGTSRDTAFAVAKENLEKYFAEQGITHVDIRLSDELPRQDAGSGKFKHIINMQTEAAIQHVDPLQQK